MNFAIDYGNTLIKTGEFEEEELKQVKKFKSPEELKNYLSNQNIDGLIISSVNKAYDEILPYIPFKDPLMLDSNLNLPFTNKYQSPESLGADRIAAITGAFSQFQNANLLVIDFGTCITFDFMNKNREYLGGAISPGIFLSFRAMHHFTARLPLIENYEDIPLIGNNTELSMKSGVVNGKIAEINAIIERYKAEFTDLKIFICGGDVIFFERNIKHTIFAEENLVLIGLNYLLNYNNKKGKDIG